MRYLWLLILSFYGCRQQAGQHTDVFADSVIADIRKGVGEYFHLGQSDAANRYLDSISAALNPWHHPAIDITWQAYKGAALTLNDQDDSARYYINTAIDRADRLQLHKQAAIARIQLVTFLIKQQRFDSALHHAMQALSIARTDAPPETPLLLLQLANLYRIAGDSTRERQYLFEGLGSAKDSLHLAAFHTEIVRYFVHYNHYDSALYFFERFRRYHHNAGSYLNARHEEDRGQLLMGRGEYSAAIRHLQTAVVHYRQQGVELPAPYYRIGICYFHLGDLQRSARYLDTTLVLYRRNNETDMVSATLYYQSAIHSRQRKWAAAYHLLDSSYIYHLNHDTTDFHKQAKEIEGNLTARWQEERIASLARIMQASEAVSRQRLFMIIVLMLSVPLLIMVAILSIRRRRMQLLLRETELQQQLLRSQMAPHFIFNALSVLQSYIRNGKTGQSLDFLSRFSRLLRISLENARHSIVPLQQEITALEHYLFLQSAQLENGFDYFIETYPHFAKDDVLIPPMLMQPFVENAIMHGFANRTDRGWITIKIIRHTDTIRCVIEDNGWGTSNGNVVKNKRSLSTAITRERLQLLSRQTSRKASLEIIDKASTEEGKGIRVILDIPFSTTTFNH